MNSAPVSGIYEVRCMSPTHNESHRTMSAENQTPSTNTQSSQSQHPVEDHQPQTAQVYRPPPPGCPPAYPPGGFQLPPPHLLPPHTPHSGASYQMHGFTPLGHGPPPGIPPPGHSSPPGIPPPGMHMSYSSAPQYMYPPYPPGLAPHQFQGAPGLHALPPSYGPPATPERVPSQQASQVPRRDRPNPEVALGGKLSP